MNAKKDEEMRKAVPKLDIVIVFAGPHAKAYEATNEHMSESLRVVHCVLGGSTLRVRLSDWSVS